jgi:hypothetical protein
MRHGVRADGWLITPEGKRAGAMCRAHAQAVIDEYAAKLGMAWTFEERGEA